MTIKINCPLSIDRIKHVEWGKIEAETENFNYLRADDRKSPVNCWLKCPVSDDILSLEVQMYQEKWDFTLCLSI